MTGVQMVIAAGAPSPYRGMVGGATQDFSTSPATATATTTFQTDGSVTHATSSSPGPMSSWFLPNVAGIGNSHWVRATIVSGTFTTGTAGSWLALSSLRTWTKTQNVVGASTVSFTLELATDSGGTNIVKTASCSLTAEMDV